MPAALYDAHLHLARPELLSSWDEIAAVYAKIGVRKVVCNGTAPADWPSVLELAKQHKQVIPAIGLHPWQVSTVATGWKEQFTTLLDQGAQAVGEIGLDQWIDGYDIKAQQDAFKFQLQSATNRNLPVSIHCLKAIGPLMDTLRSSALPERGIHIHAYNGPLELIHELIHLGGYFSFNAGQLRPDRPKVIENIRAVPAERILIETDAPDFLPNENLREFSLSDPTLCHPGNIQRGYEAIATLRNVSVDTLSNQVESNFLHYFG